jgi:hypothetical protein
MATHTKYPQGMRSHRALVGLSMTAAIGILALTGCTSERHPSPTALPGADASPSVSATPAPSGAAPPTGTAAASPAAKAPARRPDGSCPVSAETLMSALKASSTDMYTRVGRPYALQEITCDAMFAVAVAVRDSDMERGSVLFGFDVDSQTWRALNIGTGDICVGYVSVQVAVRLGC